MYYICICFNKNVEPDKIREHRSCSNSFRREKEQASPIAQLVRALH